MTNQLLSVSALAYEAEGRVFESPRAHQFSRRALMFYVYVLRNLSNGRHYTGYTADLQQPIGQHNHGITKSTKNRGAWALIYHEELPSRAEAMRREKYLKSGKRREELRGILRRQPA